MKRLISVIVMLMTLAAPQIVRAQEGEDAKMEVVASLWCDTALQLETVLRAHYTDKVPLQRAIAEINRFSPEACVIARALVNPGAEVKRMTAGDRVISLRSARVLGIMRGGYALMMTPQTWYFMHVVAELVPL